MKDSNQLENLHIKCSEDNRRQKKKGFGYLFSKYFINRKSLEDSQRHCLIPLVYYSPWVRVPSFSISWGEVKLTTESSIWKPTCCQHCFSAVLTQANSWKYREVLRNNWSNSDKCLKHRLSKLILTLIRVKIFISSSFPSCFSSSCHSRYHRVKKKKQKTTPTNHYHSHAQVNVTLPWFWISQFAHSENMPKRPQKTAVFPLPPCYINKEVKDGNITPPLKYDYQVQAAGLKKMCFVCGWGKFHTTDKNCPY